MADEQHTGGMLALVPDNATELAVEGGEPADQLHLTLLYLGDDVTSWPDGQADRLRELVTASAPALDAVDGRIMGHAIFNPDWGPDGDRDPCAVFLIGDAPGLEPLRSWAKWVMTTGEDYATPPEQHTPFIPHITAKYGGDTRELVTTGAVRFGTLRLALAGDVLDIPLGSEVAPATGNKSITFTPPREVRWAAVHVDGEMAEDVIEGKALDSDGLAWVAQHCGDTGRAWAEPLLDRIESKAMSPDPRAAKLRAYWAHGKGRAKWAGSPTPYRTLRRQLRKYVKSPRILNGLVANIMKLGTGIYPGQRSRGGRKSVNWELVEIKDAAALDDAGMYDGIDDWGAVFADEDLTGYADELTDDYDDGGDPQAETQRLAALGSRLVADETPASGGLFEGASA